MGKSTRTAVIPSLDRNLFNYGYKGKVLISAMKTAVFNYIQAILTNRVAATI